VKAPKPPKVVATVSARAALDAALEAALAAPAPAGSSFDDLGVPALLTEALRRRGLLHPFPIQARTLPDALAGRDVLGRAATGSGKTLAFGLPMLARLAGEGEHLAGRTGVDTATRRGPGCAPGRPRGLVLVPSRELALQVTANLTPLADMLGLRISTIVGGTGYGRQIDALARGVDILVATPGRLVDLIERQVCDLGAIEVTALDEADYMADLGFLPVVVRLLGMTPPDGQRLLFSATLDRGVAGLVEMFLHDPAVHAVAPATAAVTAMTHRVFVVDRDDKLQVAAEVAARPARTLIFVRTKHGADRLARQLGREGVDAAALHGNLAQNARQRVMADFTDGRTRVLVATDVAARGLHVDDVDLVVHYDPPADHKDYLHRSGRTARAGNAGTVISFVQSDQLTAVRKLHRDAAVDAVVETVAPGHRSVRALGASGDPIVVKALAAAPSAAGRPRTRTRPARRRGAA
jgi:superfamily II DNA/RNA helicase